MYNSDPRKSHRQRGAFIHSGPISGSSMSGEINASVSNLLPSISNGMVASPSRLHHPLHRRPGGASMQHAAIALIRPRRQQHLRLTAITCDEHCSVCNRRLLLSALYQPTVTSLQTEQLRRSLWELRPFIRVRRV